MQSQKEPDNDYDSFVVAIAGGLLSKTIVNISYYIVGHVPRTISVPCGLLLKKGGTISCVVTGPCQPRYSRDLEKLLRDQQRIC